MTESANPDLPGHLADEAAAPGAQEPSRAPQPPVAEAEQPAAPSAEPPAAEAAEQPAAQPAEPPAAEAAGQPAAQAAEHAPADRHEPALETGAEHSSALLVDPAGAPAATAAPAAPAPPPPPAPAPAPAPSPRPAPGPPPRPVPTPAAIPAARLGPAAPAAVPSTSTVSGAPAETAPTRAPSDPSTHGRVDDDGSVYVRTADGERLVGAYPGATAAEALAYFGRKYDDLVAQVDLLDVRVRTTDLAAKDALTSITRLRETVTTAAVVGDLEALATRLDALVEVVEQRRVAQDAARAKAREQARETKERIVAEAESLAESTQWKATGDRLRGLLDEWKAAPRLERRADDELWKRFSAARTAFDRARRQHFATLDAQRDEARVRKERLVAEAEALSSSTDWAPTAQRLRDLMTQWKAAGRAGRDEEEALWTRFRAAQDSFFAARSGTFAERDAGQRENLERKEALVAEAEALLPVSDLTSARRALRSISERWESIGHVPRGDRDRIEARLRRVEEALRSAEDSEWRRTNPEARARAEATVSQLRASVRSLEQKAEAARAAGREKDALDAESALDVRRSWLVEAERTLADLTR